MIRINEGAAACVNVDVSAGMRLMLDWFGC
jgi:hypothetical protein